MAITDLGLLGTGQASTAGTTLAVTNTTGAVILAGTLIHITGTWDNIASVTAPTITSSTIGGATATANHATAIGSGVTTTAGAGVWHQCFRALTTTDIAIGATIATLTSNQSAVKRAAHAEGWTGVDTTLRGTVATGTSTTGSPSVATTGTALVAGDLVVGSVSFENSAQMTGDADTLNGTWDAIVGTFTTGGAAGTNVGTGTQDKVVTATGVQTFDPTGGVADTVACVYSLVPLPDPAITQASYRLYADGTESASVALAAQDTAYTADVTAGDANLLLRTRLQSTNATYVYGTDDFQLQWEKNANGVWSDVGPSESLADGYGEANYGVTVNANSAVNLVGQTFLGNGGALTRAGFWMSKAGTPAGNMWAAIYAHTGTYGVNGVGTGPALATSTIRAQSTLQAPATALRWEDFVFDGTFTLDAGTPYVLVIAVDTWISSANTYNAGSDASAPTHPGTRVNYNGTIWSSNSSQDLIFRVFTTPTPVLPFNSASLTDGAATTNRLGAGTGSFQAGKVSEDGLVDNLGWAANNYTELLYALTLKKAALANGDTIRFRVLRNGATTGLTYTQVPTIPVTISAGTRTGRPKVWTGSAWANKPAKVWTGSTWVEKPVKVWSGTAWVPAR